MKTKTFLLLCLFLGIATTQLSAQNGKEGTGSTSDYYIWDTFSQPVYCNGELIDYIEGSVAFHKVTHYKDGNLIWIKTQGFGEAVSVDNEDLVFTGSGEVFRVQSINRTVGLDIGISHLFLIGNQGSHYIMTFTMDLETGEITYGECVCPGNDK
ncbi:MAG: hypothetical protein MUO72_07340 [Bacteroidales bacterium]|nr:hypothetical protein [Bacteroidales bacterium]